MIEAEQPPPPAEEKKRPFQFGLSTLFVIMTLWAVFCTIAVTLGLARGIVLAVLAVLAVWLVAIIRAFIRKRYVSACVQSLLLLIVYEFFLPTLSDVMQHQKKGDEDKANADFKRGKELDPNIGK